MTFGIVLFFHLQVLWEEAPNLVDPLERATLRHWALNSIILDDKCTHNQICSQMKYLVYIFEHWLFQNFTYQEINNQV